MSIDKLALTAQPPATAGWARGWPQHHHNNDYVVMDTGVMSYDSRPANTSPLNRPAMAPQFFPSNSFSAAPMTTVTTPPFSPHLQYGGGYPSYSPPSMLGSPFKQHQYAEKPQLRLMPVESDPGRGQHYPRDCRPYLEVCRSPSFKTDPHMSRTGSVSSSCSSISRTIKSNAPVNGASQVEFNTPVDSLMKTLQSKSEPGTPMKQAESPQYPVDEMVKPEQMPLTPPQEQPQKRFMCPVPGCDKLFSQKTHVDTHKRAHTGECPYRCPVPGCGSTFSQKVNLMTHQRRHMGERPFKCPQCGKGFVQRGDVKAHLKTHSGTKPFVCKVDGCYKDIKSRGNLKVHMNKFHSKTIEALSEKFAAMDEADLSRDDREMRDYLNDLFKNSNKGIKGRGKHRKVENRESFMARFATPQSRENMSEEDREKWEYFTGISSRRVSGGVMDGRGGNNNHYRNVEQHMGHLSPTTPSPTIPSQYQFPQHGLPQLHHTPQHPFPQHSLPPHHGLSHPAAYSMSRPNILNAAAPHHHPYELFDPEDGSVSSSGPASQPTSAGSHLSGEVHHSRELAFGDRMY